MPRALTPGAPLLALAGDLELFVAGSPGYACQLNNWLITARKYTDVPITIGLYNHRGGMSAPQQRAFESQIARTSDSRMVWRDQDGLRQTFWAWRLALLVELLSPASPLHASRYVVQADSDAVLLGDPVPALLAAHRAGYSLVSSVTDCTVRPCWPPDIADKWGYQSTLCMGFVSFAADAQTSGLVSELCTTGDDRGWCDDQRSLNHALLERGIRWSGGGEQLHGALQMKYAAPSPPHGPWLRATPDDMPDGRLRRAAGTATAPRFLTAKGGCARA